jgi:hypothetical protein
MLDFIDKSIVEHLLDPTVDKFISTGYISSQTYHKEWTDRGIGRCNLSFGLASDMDHLQRSDNKSTGTRVMTSSFCWIEFSQ